MSEWYQCVVDRDATESESPELGDSVLRWLVNEGIVSAEATDCVMSSGEGHAPGPKYAKATACSDEHLLGLRTNGLAVITERRVFHSLHGEIQIICSECSARSELPKEWGDSVDEWYENKGPGILACPQCSKTKAINEWEHDPPLVLGFLGFEFWNWPPLTDEFVQKLGKRLGHRVVMVSGKL